MQDVLVVEVFKSFDGIDEDWPDLRFTQSAIFLFGGLYFGIEVTIVGEFHDDAEVFVVIFSVNFKVLNNKGRSETGQQSYFVESVVPLSFI